MLGGVGSEYIWRNCTRYCIIILYLKYKKNPIVKLYVIHTTKSKTGQNILGLSENIKDPHLKECFSVGGTSHMLTHTEGTKAEPLIIFVCQGWACFYIYTEKMLV